jgi:EPS-associated MarR family transcriptional regulator
MFVDRARNHFEDPWRATDETARGASTMLGDEVRFKLLKLPEATPKLSLRDVASELGISLGKVNYCVNSLIEKGWIKVTNFKNSKNKIAYMYLLTPRGLEEKAGITARFLQRKLREHAMLTAAIEEIRDEAERESRRSPA